MKPPILIGVALAVVIVAAAIISPALRASSTKTAEKAQLRAALAERELGRVSLTVPRLSALADVEDMKKNEADFKAAAALAAADPNGLLPLAAREYAEMARAAQKQAKDSGLSAPKLPALAADESGVQKALTEFQSMVQANNALLKAALADAQAAVGLDPSALGVSQAQGMAEYVRAASLLAEAEELRLRQAAVQARLLDVTSQGKVAQGYLEHYRGLDVGLYRGPASDRPGRDQQVARGCGRRPDNPDEGSCGARAGGEAGRGGAGRGQQPVADARR